jgi:hypothetical protein
MKTGRLFLLFCSVFWLAGCRETMTVNLPENFHGGVLISCGSDATPELTVTVDEKGLGTAQGCPQKPVRLQILRAGAEVRPLPTNPPMWNRTDAGTMSGVEFVVP